MESAHDVVIGITALLCMLALAGSFYLFWYAASGIRNYKAEAALWEELKGRGEKTSAQITAADRQERRMVVSIGFGGRRMAAVRLRVKFEDRGGRMHTAEIRTFVEEYLLANFVAGRTVALVYDPADPSRVAVDRSLTSVQLPAQSR